MPLAVFVLHSSLLWALFCSVDLLSPAFHPRRTLCAPITVDFQQIMHDAVQFPLNVHLGPATQTKPLQPPVVRDITKHRLGYCQATAVLPSPFLRIDLHFHFGGIGLPGRV